MYWHKWLASVSFCEYILIEGKGRKKDKLQLLNNYHVPEFVLGALRKLSRFNSYGHQKP